jgi:hypothetical protein
MGQLFQAGQIMCGDCHMPEVSGAGTRTAHLFRINPAALPASANVKTENNDSGKPTVYWKNVDGTTDPNGDSFLTLDLVCTKCHKTSTLQAMSQAAPYVHRNFGMIDLTVNGNESLTTVKKAATVKVNLSVQPDALTGMKATWAVMLQGPKGWYSYNGTQWVRGQSFWLKDVPLAAVPSQVVFNDKLTTPGLYTFWVGVYPKSSTQKTASVQVQVTP